MCKSVLGWATLSYKFISLRYDRENGEDYSLKENKKAEQKATEKKVCD